MKKVLFLTGTLQNYRIPILNIIASRPDIDLTVAHSGTPNSTGNIYFKEVILKESHFLKFSIHGRDFQDFCSSFDVVVAMFYLQKISFFRLALKKRRPYKLIYWGIGVKASQKSKYDSPTPLNYLRYYLAKKADAVIFYTEYPIAKYVSNGVQPEKLFVMHNTVVVRELVSVSSRETILFVGSLKKSKKIFELLEAYLSCFCIQDNMPVLDIVGGGTDLDLVKAWVLEKKLEHKIKVHGPVYDENVLGALFQKAIACISPGQAGLSVLKSMGYGVPFITKFDAITGGERLNIQPDVTGVLYHKHCDLQGIILDIVNNPGKYKRMGEAAKQFYQQYRTPEIMAQGFIDAVNYSLSH